MVPNTLLYLIIKIIVEREIREEEENIFNNIYIYTNIYIKISDKFKKKIITNYKINTQ